MPVSRTQMYRQLGNSVAIPVIKSVADCMKAALKDVDSQCVEQVSVAI